jgi:uncharacterized phage protein gp47/JayE
MIKTAAQYLSDMIDSYEADTGAVIDRERDQVLVPFLAAIAAQLGAIDEGWHASREQLDPAQATGTALDALSNLVGVLREQATASTAIVTLSGTPGTVIPADALMEGGGVGDRARWRLLAPVTIGGGGTVAGEVEATRPGRIEAGVGEISKVVSVVSGWSGVTNAAAAVTGTSIESDQDLRARRFKALFALRGKSCAAIRTAAEALPGVQSAQVFDNATNEAQVIASLSFPPHSFAVVVYPEQDTTEKKEALARMIYDRRSPGVETVGAESAIISGEGILPTTIRWQNAEEVEVDVDVALTLASGVTVGSVTLAVEQAVGLVFAASKVGDVVRRLAILARLAAIPGILSADVLLNGVAADYTPTLVQRPVAGAINVT